MSMKKKGELLADWAVQKISSDYPEDVCLLLAHTALRLEKDLEATSISFYIPATSRSNGLARDFIIDGIGHDLFPMNWERMEKMADMRDYNTTCLADAEILYARSEADRQRFLSLQAKLRANLMNPALMLSRAKDWLAVATETLRGLLFEDALREARTSAAYVCDTLSLAVAFANRTYFAHGQTDQIKALRAMAEIPEGFTVLYEQIVRAKTVEELRRLCHGMVKITKDFLAAKEDSTGKRPGTPDFSELALWYAEMSYTWRRVYHWCDAGDAVNAFLWCCYLQHEVSAVGPVYGVDDLDLYGAFDAGDLAPFRARLEAVERAFVSAIEAHGAAVESYPTVEAFLAGNA